MKFRVAWNRHFPRVAWNRHFPLGNYIKCLMQSINKCSKVIILSIPPNSSSCNCQVHI